jgi:hypothetical protein
MEWWLQITTLIYPEFLSVVVIIKLLTYLCLGPCDMVISIFTQVSMSTDEFNIIVRFHCLKNAQLDLHVVRPSYSDFEMGKHNWLVDHCSLKRLQSKMAISNESVVWESLQYKVRTPLNGYSRPCLIVDYCHSHNVQLNALFLGCTKSLRSNSIKPDSFIWKDHSSR